MTSLESFYADTVLPNFTLPEGSFKWKGHGQLDIDSSLHYFVLNGANYLLVFESTPGPRDHLTGNAVAPHESLRRIVPKDTAYTDVYIRGDNDRYVADMTGYFTLYQILTPEELSAEFHKHHGV